MPDVVNLRPEELDPPTSASTGGGIVNLRPEELDRPNGLTSVPSSKSSPPTPVQTSVHPSMPDLPSPSQAVQDANAHAQKITQALTSIGEQAQPTIGAAPHPWLNRLEQVFTGPDSAFGASRRSTLANPGDATGKPTANLGELIPPAAAGNVADFTRGVASGVSGLTTPESLGIMAALGPLARIPAAGRLAAAGFSASLIKSLYDQGGEFKKALDSGDQSKAAQIAGQMAVAGTLAGFAGAHALKGAPPPAPLEGKVLPPERAPMNRHLPAGEEPVAPYQAAEPPAPIDQQPKRAGRRATKMTPQKPVVPDVVEQPSGAVPASRQTVDLDPAEVQHVPTVDLKPEDVQRATETTKGAKANDNRNTVSMGRRGEPQAESEQTEQRPGAAGGAQQSGGRETEAAQEEKEVAPRTPVTEPAYGNETTIRVPGEKTAYAARYAVREASDVQPSHNPFSFEANPEYHYQNDRDYSQPDNATRVIQNGHGGTYDPAYTLSESPTAENGAPVIDPNGNALGGNSRTMTQQRVYQHNPGGAAAYRERLANTAQNFGLDPAELRRFKNPILVRELTNQPTKVGAQNAITDFNKTAAAKLAPEEQAVSDGRRLSPRTIGKLSGNLADIGEGSTLAQALQGDKGDDILNSLVTDGVLTPQEKGGMLDERGQLTAGAKDRIAKALVGRMYEAPADYARAAPETRQKLEKIAPHVLRVEDRPEWSLTQPVREAVNILAEAKAHGVKNLGDLARQEDLTGAGKSYSPEAIAIAKTLQQNPNAAVKAFRQYANDAELSRDGAQVSFFEPPARAEAFASAFGKRTPEPLKGAAAAQDWTSVDTSVPHITGGAGYQFGQRNEYHLVRSKVAELRLPPEESKIAVAASVNVHAMELIGRMAGLDSDVGATRVGGLHLPPETAAILAQNLTGIIGGYAHPPKDILQLRALAQEAVLDKKSLVMVKHTEVSSPAQIQRNLREELNHARQYMLDRKGASQHLGEGAKPLTNGQLAVKAKRALEGPVYQFDTPGQAASEIGVRLMDGNRYHELGLTLPEARQLAAHYVRSLRKEYGHARPQEIIRDVFAALRKPVGGVESKSGALPDIARPGRGAGTPGRARSDLRAGDEANSPAELSGKLGQPLRGASASEQNGGVTRQPWQENALRKVSPTARRLYAAMEDLEREPDVPVSAPRLRLALPDLDKASFDKAALELRAQRLVYGSTHDYPLGLKPHERDMLIDTGQWQTKASTDEPDRRQYFVALSRLKDAPAETKPGAVTSKEHNELAAKLRGEQTQRAETLAKLDDGQRIGKLLRAAAGSMQAQIDAKRSPAIAEQNPTARRARIAGGMAKDADSMEQTQTILRNLAAAHETGAVPAILNGVKSRGLVETLRNRSKFPGAFINSGYAREVADKMRGRPNTKKAIEYLDRFSDGVTVPESRFDEIGDLFRRAQEAGITSGRYGVEVIAESRRLAKAGLNEDNWAQARGALKRFEGTEKPELTKERQIADLERALIGRKIPGYFPTPKDLAARMVEKADIEPGMSVLEPSAGNGRIADEAAKRTDNLKTIEPVDDLRNILKLKGHTVSTERDFLEHQNRGYDRVVMNPPFENGQDVDHVRHAFNLLKTGGRVVAIMGEHPFFAGDAKSAAFRDWLAEHGGTSEKLPPGTFEKSGTGANARLVTIDKTVQAGSDVPAPWQMTAAEYRDAVMNGEHDFKGRGIEPRRGSELAQAVRNAERNTPQNAWIDRRNLEKAADSEHSAAVAMAVAKELPVPANVLAEYPGLQKLGAKNLAKAETGGHYYVSQIRDGKYRAVAGPFASRTEAEARVTPVRKSVTEKDDWSDFDAFGVMRSETPLDETKLLKPETKSAGVETNAANPETKSLFSETEDTASKTDAALDKAKLAGQRLTAQLNAPLTREEQLRKLKRAKSGQASMFGGDEGPKQGSLFSVPLRQPPAHATPTQEAAAGDARFVRGAQEGSGKIYINRPGFLAVVALDASARGVKAPNTATEGWTLGGGRIEGIIEKINEQLAHPNRPTAFKQALHRIGEAIMSAYDDNPRALIFVPVREKHPLSDIKETARQEGFHQAQIDLAVKSGTSFETQLDPVDLFANPALAKASMPIEKAYGKIAGAMDIDALISIEVPAWLGAGQYKHLGLTRSEALDGLEHYFTLLFAKYGPDKAIGILARVQPELRKELYGRFRQRGINLASTTGDARPGGVETPGRPDSASQLKSDLASISPKSLTGSGTQPEGAGESGSPGARLPEGRQGSVGGEVRRDVPGEKALASRKESQGGFLRVKDPDAAETNYSGLGALENVTTRNLSQLRRADPVAWEAAVKAASSKSQASVLIKTAMPRIEKALKGDHSLDEFRTALIESRLQGIQQRWTNLADMAARATPRMLDESADRLLPLLAHVEDRAGFGRNLEQTAASLLEKKDYDSLRTLLGDTFTRAASSVTHVLDPAQFDALRYSPSFRDGLRVYKDLLEKPMAESHDSNEGVFSDALGPLDTYYPLVPLRDESEVRLRTASKPEYSRPKNLMNNFATGLSENYDASMDAFRQKMTAAVKANNKAAFMDSLVKQGLVVPLKPFERAGDRIAYRGQEYHAVRMETTPARVIVQGGKSTHLPPNAVLVPKWLEKELEPVLQNKFQHPTLGTVRQIASLANEIAISGPADFVFHSANLFGTLVANTPFLGNSMLGKAASLPILKRFTSVVKIATTDPTTEEAARDLKEMADLGIVPDRFGSETYSRKYAEMTGAKLRRFTAGPMLNGPKGIDVRARLVMYRLAKEIDPRAGGPQLHMFVNQLGNYVDSLQSQFERSAKHVGLSPFATAGTTMLRNGINAWTGAGPMPSDAPSLRIWQQLTGGGIGLVALWALAQHQYTGKWPWQDRRSKLLQIPVNDPDRRSKLGKRLWGKGPETGYLNFSFFNPLVGRGARALGIKGAADTAMEGGKWWQDLEAAQRDVMNSFAHPWLGPIPRAAFVGLTGDEPYITGLRDDRAKLNPQLMPAVRKAGEGSSIGKRAAAAAKELNSFYGNVAANSGLGETNAHDTTNHWQRMIFDLALPGLVGNGQNPYKQGAYLKRQAAAARRQR